MPHDTAPASQPSQPLEPAHAAAAQYFWYGHRKLRRPSELELCWKIAKAIAAGDGIVSDDELAALLGKMTATATPQSIIDAVLAWDEHTETPTELLAQLQLSPDALRELGLWILYEGLSVGLGDDWLGFAEIEVAHEVARATGIPLSTVHVLSALCRDESSLRLRRIKALQGGIGAVPGAPSRRGPSRSRRSRCAARAPAARSDPLVARAALCLFERDDARVLRPVRIVRVRLREEPHGPRPRRHVHLVQGRHRQRVAAPGGSALSASGGTVP